LIFHLPFPSGLLAEFVSAGTLRSCEVYGGVSWRLEDAGQERREHPAGKRLGLPPSLSRASTSREGEIMTSPSQHIMRLGLGFTVSQTLRVVIELGIPDLLAAGEQSVEALASAAKVDAGALYRVMRLLAAEGVFTEGQPRRFSLTQMGAALRSDRPGPRDFIQMINGEAYLAFEQLLHSVRTGKPAFDKVFGSLRFDWLSDHPEQAALF
jgi:hypothetical protein